MPEKNIQPFPWLFITSALFLFGIVLLGGTLLLSSHTAQPSKATITPLSTTQITPTPTPLFTQQVATPSSQPAPIIFPTKKLTLTIPTGWQTTTGPEDTHQILQWWLPDNTLIITSPDTTTPTANCPEGGCQATFSASLTISEYGANAFITPQAWYEGKSLKENSTLTSASPSSPLIVSSQTFAGLSFYCATPQSTVKITSIPSSIPTQLIGGTCYTIWQAHVYGIAATITPSATNNKQLIAQIISLLESIHFIQ